MSEKHKEAYWNEPLSVGRLLKTPATDRWSDNEKQEGDARERLFIFAGFKAGDMGRSRSLIADCRESMAHFNRKQVEANTLRLVAAWNACLGISTSALEAGCVRELVEAVKKAIGTLGHAQWCGANHADTDCKCSIGKLARAWNRIEGGE